MDLIDEQHVARLQVGEDRRQIAGPLEHRTCALAQAHAELGRDDVRECRLAQPRRPEDQHVIERLAALASRADEDLQLRLDLLLADVILEAPRTDGALDGLLLPACDPADDSLRFHWHWSTPAPRPAVPAGSVPQSSVYRDRPTSASVSPPPDGIRGQ